MKMGSRFSQWLLVFGMVGGGLAGCGGGSGAGAGNAVADTPNATPAAPDVLARGTGWMGPESENNSTVPVSANASILTAFGESPQPDPNLESRSLASAPVAHSILFLPAVQDQGTSSMGPAWAVSVQLSAMANQWKYYNDINAGHDAQSNALASNIASARYLYTAQPNSASSGKVQCQGATLIGLYEAIVQNKGVASQASLPNFDATQSASTLNCDANLLVQNPQWSADKADFTINGYRKVALTVDAIKEELLLNNTVVFGAKVGNAFFQYKSGVYGVTQASAADASVNASWHTMNIVGYDDEKQSFKIQNTWGAHWGEEGFAWVSYVLMLDTKLWVADNSLYAVYKTHWADTDLESDVVSLMQTQGLSNIYVNPLNVTQVSRTPVTGYLKITSNGSKASSLDLAQTHYSWLEICAGIVNTLY